MSELEVAVPFQLPRALSGTDERLRTSVDEHYDALWHALRRLGVPQTEAEDATQQVFLVFSRRIDEVLPGAERSFLFGTAVRVASDYRKKQSRSREVLDEPTVDRERDTAPDPEELLDARRARKLLDEALAELPMDLRAVFVLFEFEEMTMAAIAKALDLPPGTVASRLRRAREAFQIIVNGLRERVRTGRKS